jgi:hypothetical protein
MEIHVWTASSSSGQTGGGNVVTSSWCTEVREIRCGMPHDRAPHPRGHGWCARSGRTGRCSRDRHRPGWWSAAAPPRRRSGYPDRSTHCTNRRSWCDAFDCDLIRAGSALTGQAVSSPRRRVPNGRRRRRPPHGRQTGRAGEWPPAIRRSPPPRARDQSGRGPTPRGHARSR